MIDYGLMVRLLNVKMIKEQNYNEELLQGSLRVIVVSTW